MSIFYLTIITILVSLFILKHCIIKFYLRKNNVISYDYLLKNFLQVVNKDSYFMNYGLWEKDTLTLQDASINLCDTIYNLVLHENSNNKILDVGCGYGSQDFYWYNKLQEHNKLKEHNKVFELCAIDISQEQIDYAINKQQTLATNILFKQGNAEQINKIYPASYFNTVISLESAFHYQNRNTFFKAVHDVLIPEGTFIIADIMLKNDYKYTSTILKQMFVGLASELIYIPEKNLISKRKWLKNIKKSGFKIVKQLDITKKTFLPHYKYMFYNWLHINGIWGTTFLCDMLLKYMKYVQSFSYMIVVCQKI